MPAWVIMACNILVCTPYFSLKHDLARQVHPLTTADVVCRPAAELPVCMDPRSGANFLPFIGFKDIFLSYSLGEIEIAGTVYEGGAHFCAHGAKEERLPPLRPVCVRVRVCVHARACMCVRACVRACACVLARERVGSLCVRRLFGTQTRVQG